MFRPNCQTRLSLHVHKGTRTKTLHCTLNRLQCRILSVLTNLNCFFYFCSDLRFNSHISKVLTTCNQRLYLISQLKKQGLTVTGTEIVFNAIVLSKIQSCTLCLCFIRFYLSITSNKLKQCLRKLDVGSLLTQILSSRSWLKTTCFVYLDSPNPTLIA